MIIRTFVLLTAVGYSNIYSLLQMVVSVQKTFAYTAPHSPL